MVLDYRVTPPLDAVLTPTVSISNSFNIFLYVTDFLSLQAMLRYGRIFRFLWRLRRVDYQLGVAWAGKYLCRERDFIFFVE